MASSASLKTAAATGTVSQVEAALGELRRAAMIAAAKEALPIAMEAERWDNLAYLADFLHDVDTGSSLPLLELQSPRESDDEGGLLSFIVRIE